MRAARSVLGTNYMFLHLGQSQLQAGKLHEAEALYREASVMAEENFGSDSALKALSATFLAESLFLRNDMEGSSQLMRAACETIETTDGWLDVYATAYEIMIRQAFAVGGIEEALRIVARALETSRQRRLTRLAILGAAWRVEHLTLSGHLKEARREAQAAGLASYAEVRGKPDFNWRVRLASTVALARISIVAGPSAHGLKLLDGAAADYREAGLLLPAHRLQALSICALKQRGGSDAAAVTRLEALIQFIVEESASQLVVQEGASLEPLLHLVQRRNRELLLSSAGRDVIAKLLAALQASQPADEHGFSAREVAVVRELCNGRSNKAIGQLLDLSENTVKFHLKRIFKKLEVDSRTAAIGKAIQRGICPSFSALDARTTHKGSST
jgi:LuxR family maltose regulon positive regulatory protein